MKGPDWLDYYSMIVLCDVTFVVSEAGRRRALEKGVRNVHAWAKGSILGANIYPIDEITQARKFEKMGYVPVTYNPFKAGYFTSPSGMVSDARSVVMFGPQCWAYGVNEG